MSKQHLLKALTKIMPQRNAQLLIRRIRVLSNGCWEYLGAKNSGGFAVFSVGKMGTRSRNFMVHRVLYEAVSGQVLTRSTVCVSACGCVKPEHQRVMTKSAHVNTLDKANVRSPLLNWDAVRRIRRMNHTTNWAEVARSLGVAHSTVRMIRKNQTWQESECLPHKTLSDGRS